jgi:hypothetical protein
MAGATENPFRAGLYPLRKIQWERAAEVAALLSKVYRIPVTDKTILSHAEVQSNLGIRQNGKWDVSRLPFDKTLIGAKACGDAFRNLVNQSL